MLRYCKLWANFGEKEFTHTQADQTLSGDQTAMGVILSQMRKAGWLMTKFDENDARKRRYHLKSPETVAKEIAEVES
jgi:type I restriction enzyme M protein